MSELDIEDEVSIDMEQPWEADVLDHLNAAVRICENHDEDELAFRLAGVYQDVGRELLGDEDDEGTSSGSSPIDTDEQR